MHGANCINTEGSYMCQCLPGWTGAKCDVGMYIQTKYEQSNI